MPKVWSEMDERQYKQIRASEWKAGHTKHGGEIAARTVNKHRREGGRTLDQIVDGEDQYIRKE